jgi:hypothetical protein
MMAPMPLKLLLVQVAATLAMTGIIWFVQVVHYPLFALVGPAGFTQYEAAHATRTGWVVAPLMLAELSTSVALLDARLRPLGISAALAWVGVALVAVLWISTGLIQVPLHNQLAAGYSAGAATRLVATNWLRTAVWTARSALVLTWVAGLIAG